MKKLLVLLLLAAHLSAQPAPTPTPTRVPTPTPSPTPTFPPGSPTYPIAVRVPDLPLGQPGCAAIVIYGISNIVTVGANPFQQWFYPTTPAACMVILTTADGKTWIASWQPYTPTPVPWTDTLP